MPRSTGYLKGFRKHNGFACLILVLLAAAAGAFPYEEILSEFKRRKDD